MHTNALDYRKGLGVALAAFAISALILAGCGAAQASSSAAPAPSAVVTRSPTPVPTTPTVVVSATAVASPATGSGPVALGTPAGQAAGGTGSATPTNAAQRNQAGNVTIEATWQNQSESAGQLTFSVVMDTHSVDLDSYDLGQIAVLRNDRGLEVKPERWEAPSGGHHRSGTLAFRARDAAGNPVLGSDVKAVELVLRDVAGVKERVLRWEVSR